MNSKTITGRVADLSKDGAPRMAFEFLPASALPILAVLLLWGSCPQTSNAAPNNTTPPFTQAPPIGADTSAEYLLVINSSGGLRFKNDPTQGAYDGSDDTLV